MNEEPDLKSVLIIEDDHGVRAVLAIVLESAGFRIFEAADAAEAARVWEEQIAGFDLVVSDVLLPGLSGPEIVAEFRRERPDLKVVFISGGLPTSSPELAHVMESYQFLTKPFTPQSLLEATERAGAGPTAEAASMSATR